jgi:acetate kinase
MAMPSRELLCKGTVERIGSAEALFNYGTDVHTIERKYKIATHKAGLKKIAEHLMAEDIGVISNPNEISAIGHRVVHGGNSFSETTRITSEVKKKIKELSQLAPLHNPVNFEGIEVAEELFPNAKQVAVFDTAFHQTIPLKAKKYAIPNSFYQKHDIQLFGFHGTSHKYVAEKAIDFLGKNDSKIITVHLGNGCSITAVQNGKSVDHSMGFTPSNGLIMGTRSGDIDHSLIFYFVNNLGYDLEEVKKLLDKKSGMLGLTGYSDLRDIQIEAENGNTSCQLALEMNAYRIKKYIGAYTAVMNGLDALVFTAGIGENSNLVRELVCTNMDYLGISIDTEKNQTKSGTVREINTTSSKVKLLVIPTNEELEIAKQVYSKLSNT